MEAHGQAYQIPTICGPVAVPCEPAVSVTSQVLVKQHLMAFSAAGEARVHPLLMITRHACEEHACSKGTDMPTGGKNNEADTEHVY